MKTTILGGVLFLAPLAIIAFILGKAFQISTKIVAPLDHLLPIKNFAGIASVNILALLFIILLCYVAGLLAQRAFLEDVCSASTDFWSISFPVTRFSKL